MADNNSGDDSVRFLADSIVARGWSQWISLLPLPENGGFAYGNNKAIEAVLAGRNPPRYLWLLNPDTFVHQGACLELVNFMETHPEAGIAGSRLEDPDGTLQISAFRDHSVVSEFLSGIRLRVADVLLSRWVVADRKIHTVPVRTDWVSGASLMIRTPVFTQTGLLDEAFFMYYEEVDYCLRARKNNWECWHVPASRVVHLIGAASGITDYRKKASRRPAYWFASRRRFFLKHHHWLALFLADCLWMIGYSSLLIRRKLQRKPNFDPPFFLRDFFSNSIFFKGIRL